MAPSRWVMVAWKTSYSQIFPTPFAATSNDETWKKFGSIVLKCVSGTNNQFAVIPNPEWFEPQGQFRLEYLKITFCN
ncbi:hypothetical protein RCL_jg7994.t1 [Rhizophagus clarus]|uniref:Uncharacterized protein n=1 Tax=Rhizophagus clarus TaxID=94130 RepID=A0A8H3MKQ3_9GLOM|nr:hypothetical protein RCL_jg7994.t1 [Rhizophagus clarus]